MERLVLRGAFPCRRSITSAFTLTIFLLCLIAMVLFPHSPAERGLGERGGRETSREIPSHNPVITQAEADPDVLVQIPSHNPVITQAEVDPDVLVQIPSHNPVITQAEVDPDVIVQIPSHNPVITQAEVDPDVIVQIPSHNPVITQAEVDPDVIVHGTDLNKDEHADVRPTVSVVAQPEKQTSVCNLDKVCSQTERFAMLRKGCQKHPEISKMYNPNNRKTYHRLLVDDHHKILYCALPKAASTTFYNMFYYAVTGKHLDNIHCKACWEREGLVWLKWFSKPERDRRLKEYYKIMVVRHPLDRIVSCWNDKFFTRTTKLRKGLIRKASNVSTQGEEITNGQSFKEFVSYVNYLEMNSPETHNEHWNAHYRLCHPCSIDYDLIVKVETMQRDSKVVLDKLALNASEFPLINAKRTDESETLMLRKNVDEYKDIADDQLLGVKKLFGLDMELFDYRWNDDSLEASCGGSCDDKEGGCC